MVELQIVFIIISTLLGLLALIYKNTKKTKFKKGIQKYKLYYVYNTIFYISNIEAILFYKLKLDAMLLVLIMLYFLYLSLDLMSGKEKEENEIYTIIIMFLIIILILIVSIKYILISEIIRR